jgi:hypothetical protein
LFKKLLIGSLVMLVFGYMGEAGIMAAWPAFIVGCLAWVYMIVASIFSQKPMFPYHNLGF